MTNPYSPQSVTNYNTSPPPDDGSRVAANAVSWATIKNKLADPLLNLANAVNTAASNAFLSLFLNAVNPQSANYVVQSSDRGKLINLSNGAVATMMAASSANGNAFPFKNVGASAASIAPNGTDQIDGTNASITLNPSESVTLVSDGSNWFAAAAGTFIRWGVVGGTADALTLATIPPLKGVVDGQIVFGRLIAANATGSPTLAVDGFTARTITKNGGKSLAIADLAGAAAECFWRYNLANTRWELLNPAGGPNAAALRGFIDGLEIGAPGGAQTLTIGPGSCLDSTNASFMTVTTTYTKTMAAWAVGTGNGGLDTGAIAGTTPYFVWQIMRPDTGVIDYLISLSGTAPTMPTNYTLKRVIGWFKTDATPNILQIQQRGDTFIYGTSFHDQTAVAVTMANRTLFSLTVPSGYIVEALFRVGYGNSAGASAMIFTSPDETDQAVSATGDFGPSDVGNQVIGSGSSASLQKRTNTSAQLGARGNSTAATFDIWTYGFVWTRGRNS
ncbi:MAG TPA: hypothetical protein VF957_23550 [Bradyrhizobium sp.]